MARPHDDEALGGLPVGDLDLVDVLDLDQLLDAEDVAEVDLVALLEDGLIDLGEAQQLGGQSRPGVEPEGGADQGHLEVPGGLRLLGGSSDEVFEHFKGKRRFGQLV